MTSSAYPLQWPPGFPRTKFRSTSYFGDHGFAKARDQLLHEVQLLPARKIILSTNIPLRQDGLPSGSHADCLPDPGVAIYFEYKGKPRVFACDKWTKVSENTWALSKTIEAIRGIARWGASDMLERAFTGFTAIPAFTNRVRHWREVLGFDEGRVTYEQVQGRYQELAFKYHPDRGGDAGKMSELNRARDHAIEELR